MLLAGHPLGPLLPIKLPDGDGISFRLADRVSGDRVAKIDALLKRLGLATIRLRGESTPQTETVLQHLDRETNLDAFRRALVTSSSLDID
jgi:hypothetical protein